MITASSIGISRFVLAAALAATFAASADDSDVQVRSVEPMSFAKAMRHEISPLFGVLINDSFRRGLYAGGLYTFFPLEQLGVEISALQRVYSTDTPAWTTCAGTATSTPCCPKASS